MIEVNAKGNAKIFFDELEKSSQKADLAIKRIQSTLRELSNKTITIDIQVLNFYKILNIKKELQKLSNKNLKIKVDSDTSNIATIKQEIANLSDKTIKVKLDIANTKKLLKLSDNLKNLNNKSINVALKTTGIKDIKKVTKRLDELKNRKVKLSLEVKGVKKLSKLLERLDTLRDHRINIEAETPIGLSDANTQLQELNNRTRNTNRHFSILGRTLTAFEGFRIISNQIKDTLKDFSELEQGIAGIKKTTGLTGSSLQDLTDELTKISITTNAMDITALHKIAEGAGQLGISGKDNILEFTKVIRELSATSSLTAEQAGTEFAKLSLTLHEPIKEVKRLASTFTLLASTTTTDEKKLVNYTQRLAGMGKTFGLTTQQIVGMSATLADIGVSARLGTTAVSRLMTKMLTHTHLVADVLRLDFDKFANAIEKKPIEAINMFLERLGQLDKQNVAQALREMKLSSVGAVQTLIKLSHATGKLNKNIATSNKAYRENIALDNEFKTVQDTLKGATEKYTSAVKNMNYQLGEVLKPVVIKAQNLMTGLANKVATFAKNLNYMLTSEKRLKTYMSKTNVALRKQEKATNDLHKAQTKEKNIKKAINSLAKSYGDTLDKNSKQAKALKGALQNLVKEYGATIKKIKELKKVAKEPVVQKVKVKVDKIPKYEIKHRLPQVEVVNASLISNLTDFSNTTSLTSNLSDTSLKKLEHLERVKVSRLKKYQGKEALINREAHRRALLDLANIQLREFKRTLSHHKRTRRAYRRHYGKLGHARKSYYKRKYTDAQRATNKINHFLLRSAKASYNTRVSLLKKEYEKYKRLGVNRLKLEEWYQAKLATIKKSALRKAKSNSKAGKATGGLIDYKEIIEANNQINDYILKATKGEFALEKKLLKDKYNEYKKLGVNRLQLKKWYNLKSRELEEEHNRELKASTEEINNFIIRNTKGEFALEKKLLRERYEEYKKQGVNKLKLEKWYQLQLAKLREEENRKAKEVQGKIDDFLLVLKKGEFELERKQLKKTYEEYKKLNIDKVKLEEWYQAKIKDIREREHKHELELAKQREEELRKATEKRVKKELEWIDKELRKYHNLGIGTFDIKAEIKTIFDKVGLTREFNGIFKGVSDDFVKNIANSLSSGKVSQGLTNNILDLVKNLAYGNTKDDGKNEKYGKAIGGSAGAIAGYALGGSIGGKVGETLGVLLGGSIGRAWNKAIVGKKSEWIKFIGDDLGVYIKKSAHLNHKSIYRLNEDRTNIVKKELDRTFNSFNSFYQLLGLKTKDFYKSFSSLGKFKTKDLAVNIGRQFIAGLAPNLNKEELTAVYNDWKQYTKDTKESVAKAIIDELSKVTQVKRDIAVYLAEKNKNYEKAFKAKTVQDLSIIKSLGDELDVHSIEQYNTKLQRAIKNGKVLTKEEIAKWNSLGKALLDYNQQYDSYRQSLIDERDKLKELIKQRKGANDELGVATKELLDFRKSLDDIVASKNQSKSNLSSGVNTENKTLEDLTNQFKSYADSNANTIVGIVDTAIARNRIYEAGRSIEVSKLTYGESKQIESLDKLEKRLASIESILEKQGETLTATEKNTYISANKR